MLSCVAALQLVKEAAEGCDAEGMAAALQDAVGPQLGALLQPGQDVALQCASLQVGAGQAGAAEESGLLGCGLEQQPEKCCHPPCA